jgi:membrane protease YdiL (CAAX protease family)
VSTAPLEDVARYVGVPAAVPLALVVLGAAIGGCRVAGASWAGLGFGRGRQATIVIAVIGTPLLLLIVVFVAIGIVTPANLAPVAVVSAVVAAVEEIYFRGCLQSRFERTWGTAWGLVITALVFALFHTAMLTGATHASLPVAAAAGVAQQGVLGGLVLGVAFQRTRTLAVPIIVHALGNTALIPLFT